MPRLMASVGEAIVTGLAVQQNFPFIWMVHAIQDLHQRAFAGAILPKQRMDFTRLHVKVDTVDWRVRRGSRLLMPRISRLSIRARPEGSLFEFAHRAILNVVPQGLTFEAQNLRNFRSH